MLRVIAVALLVLFTEAWGTPLLGQVVLPVEVRQLNVGRRLSGSWESMASLVSDGQAKTVELLQFRQIRDELELVDFQQTEMAEQARRAGREVVLDLGTLHEQLKSGELSRDEFGVLAFDRMAKHGEQRNDEAKISLLPHQQTRLNEIELQLVLRTSGIAALIQHPRVLSALDVGSRLQTQVTRDAERARSRRDRQLELLRDQFHQQVRERLSGAQRLKLEQRRQSAARFSKLDLRRTANIQFFQPEVLIANNEVARSLPSTFSGATTLDANHPMSSLASLMFSDVQRVLGMTQNQVRSLQDLRTQFQTTVMQTLNREMAKVNLGPGVDLQTIRRDVGSLVRELELAGERLVKELLSEAQYSGLAGFRCQQKYEQLSPTEFYRDPWIANYLGISSDQQRQLEESLLELVRQQRNRLFEVNASYFDEGTASLSEDQQRQLKMMLGVEFKPDGVAESQTDQD